jgi:hypothetical protein
MAKRDIWREPTYGFIFGRIATPFLDYEMTLAELERQSAEVPLTAVESSIAALEVGHHLLLNGGTRTARAALARALVRTALELGIARGYYEIRLRPSRTWTGNTNWGLGTLADATQSLAWLLLHDIDLWGYATTGLAQGLTRTGQPSKWRVVATAATLSRRPAEREWQAVKGRFAWIDVTAAQ